MIGHFVFSRGLFQRFLMFKVQTHYSTNYALINNAISIVLRKKEVKNTVLLEYSNKRLDHDEIRSLFCLK